MGGRGAFVNLDENDYTFKNGQQIYHTIGIVNNVKYIIQDEGKSGKKIPDYSHSSNTIYALISNHNIKSIGVYENHMKIKSYDLSHTHFEPTLGTKLNWHYHTDLYHKEPAHALDQNDLELVNAILKGAQKFL